LRRIAAAILAVPVIASFYFAALLAVLRGRRSLAAFGAVVAVSALSIGIPLLSPARSVPAPTRGSLADLGLGGIMASPGQTAKRTAPVDPQIARISVVLAPAKASARTAVTRSRSVRTLGASAPELVRFRPTTGTAQVDPTALLSVRFSQPMNRVTTARAFAVVVAGARVTGTVSWAEDDTVLVFKPTAALAEGSAVGIRVLGSATSADGVPIRRGGSATFKVVAAQLPTPTVPKQTPKPVIGSGGARATHPAQRPPIRLPRPVPVRKPVHINSGPAGIEGIDISHHDGTIDWRQVAASGTSFAYVKASEGTTYVDLMYATNRANAEAAGLKVGAFHYAEPDASPGEAAAEADHFVDTAAFKTGELVPMLDLEVTNGLSPGVLQAWVATFLDRVYQRTGLHAGVYVSPSFWQTYLNDTASIASLGYGVLWIADWTAAPTPWVPASDWGGLGWTLWQYSHQAIVAGVPGPVDVDHFSGPDLASLLIR